MYIPVLKSARPVYRYRIGDLLALIVTDCEGSGMIQYTHVLYVFKPNEPAPIFAVAAEMNRLSASTTQGRLFLGVFPGDAHLNLGMSEDWLDLDKFTAKALDIARGHFKIEVPPMLLPLNDPRLN